MGPPANLKLLVSLLDSFWTFPSAKPVGEIFAQNLQICSFFFVGGGGGRDGVTAVKKLKLIFCITFSDHCSPTCDSGDGDCSHEFGITSWTAVGKNWTAEVEFQFLDCIHYHPPPQPTHPESASTAQRCRFGPVEKVRLLAPRPTFSSCVADPTTQLKRNENDTKGRCSFNFCLHVNILNKRRCVLFLR